MVQIGGDLKQVVIGVAITAPLEPEAAGQYGNRFSGSETGAVKEAGKGGKGRIGAFVFGNKKVAFTWIP